VPDARSYFDIVFVLVLVFTLVQGTTLGRLARLLKLASASEAQDVEVDSAPLEDLDADLLQVRVPAGSQLHGVTVRELRLPVGAAVSLLVRGGRGWVPGPDTRLRHGDQLLLVTTSPARAATERRLRAVGRAGRLATWRGEAGERERRPGDRPTEGR
jgi:cell volume regulation protein A